MVTKVVTSERETSMSEEAFELINFFYNGVDILVRELAEQIAVDADSFLSDRPDVVAIEKAHVEEAGRRVMSALQQLLKDGKLRPELSEHFGEMSDCFDIKS